MSRCVVRPFGTGTLSILTQSIFTPSETMHTALLNILAKRGITEEEREKFLSPDFVRDTHNPFLFRQMREATERLLLALEQGEVIVVHGDYDADGISGTALLLSVMENICERAGFSAYRSGKVRSFLPDRETDGYGMNTNTVEQFKSEGVNVIVTVDNGIACIDSIKHAYELGMEVVVVDHHQLANEIPERAIIIHPLVPGETYPFSGLCGTGVAYKLATAMYEIMRERGVNIPEGTEKWQLDLVAIATVTDMVPMLGENRVLEFFGLKVLNKTKRIGLLALMEVAGLGIGRLNTEDIGFRLGPRLNAAGRMAHANEALAVILEKDNKCARELAERLNELNVQRQKETEIAMRQARSVCIIAGQEKSMMIFVSEEMRPGIAGLVAGKLMQESGRPALALSRVGDRYVGSGRAPEGFHLVEAMNACSEHMIRGGGHPQACGFTIHEEKVSVWVEAMERYATLSSLIDVQSVIADAELVLSDVGPNFLADLQSMEPFGMGNAEPLFSLSGVQMLSAEPIGKTGTHARLTLSDGKTVMDAVAFGQMETARTFQFGDKVDLLFHVKENVWNGRSRPQIRVEEIHGILNQRIMESGNVDGASRIH